MTAATGATLALHHDLSAMFSALESSCNDVDETDFSFRLENRRKELTDQTDSERHGGLAEVMAFQMVMTDDQGRSRWGTRFGPFVELEQGPVAYIFPDIAKIDALVLDYWARRHQETKHPIFKA